MWKDIQGYAPARLIPMLIGVLALPLMARMLSKEAFGAYILGVAVVNFAANAGYQWLASPALRFYRPMESDRARYYSCVAFLVVVASLLVLAVGAAVRGWIPERYRPMLLLAIPLTVLYGIFLVYQQVQRARGSIARYNLFQIAEALGRNALGVLALWLLAATAAAFFVGWLVSAFIVTGLLLWLAGSLRSFRPAAVEGKPVKDMLAFGLPVALMSIGYNLLANADKFVVARLCTDSELALYGMGWRLGSASVAFVGLVVQTAVYPMAIDAYERERRFDQASRQGIRYFVLIAVPLASFAIMLAPDILRVVAGQAYLQAAGVLRLAVLATLALAAGMYSHIWYLVRKKTPALTGITLAAGLAGLGLLIALVWAFGYVGAAWGMLATYALMGVCLFAFAVRLGPVRLPWGSLLRGGIACGLELLLLWGFSRWGWSRSLIGLTGALLATLGLHLAALYVLREIPRRGPPVVG